MWVAVAGGKGGGKRFVMVSDKALQHPCDTALGLLVSPRAFGTILYLTDSPFTTTDSGDQYRGMRAIVEYLVRSSRAALDEPPGYEAASAFMGIGCDSQLPFGDASTNLLVLSLTASWPASAWRRYQLLSEIRRVLAVDGELLILTRNRYGYRRLSKILQPPTRESGILAKVRAFGVGSLRLLANSRSLPSQQGLRVLLAKAGFRSVEWFRPLRDRQGCFTEIRPFYPRENEWGAYLPMSTSGRIQRFPGVADEFIIRASVGALAPSALQRCLQEMAHEIASDSTAEPAVGIERFLITPKEKVVVMASLNNVPVVMRIPLSESAYEGCQRNLQALQAIDIEPARRGLAPVPLAESAGAGCYYTVESRLSGVPLGRNPLGQNELAQVKSLMQRLNPRSLIRQTILDGSLYDELVARPLKKVLALIPEAHKQDRLERFFKDRLFGKRVTVGISHGDFSLSNIFVQCGQTTGAIDWDDSYLTGLPIMNAISYLCSRQGWRNGNFSSTVLNLATKQWPYANELAFLDGCYMYFRTDPSAHPALVLLFWVAVIASQSEFWFAKSPSYFQSRIDNIMNEVTCDDWPA